MNVGLFGVLSVQVGISKVNMQVNDIICGDNMEVMAGFANDTYATIITDPPYGLGFMGKKWDTFKPDVVSEEKKRDKLSHSRRTSRNKPHSDQPSAAQAAGRYDRSLPANMEFQQWFTRWGIEALRVLKPGGTLLIFGGTRTYHRLACAIEDAGFTIKDCIMWIYGSGFPKATDISKQLDKYKRRDYVLAAKKLGILPKDANRSFIDWTEENHSPSDKYWEEFKKVISREDWEKIERKILGKRKVVKGVAFTSEGKEELDITEPNSEQAKLWSGWKSHGLKPAYEPILLAMKPNDGTYAHNALEHGVSGLNIDGGRIPLQEHGEDKRLGGKGDWSTANAAKNVYEGGYAGVRTGSSELGRHPANVILDPESAAMLDEQSGELTSGKMDSIAKGNQYNTYGKMYERRVVNRANSGGASRFFYCAKASKRERNAGCEGLTEKAMCDIDKMGGAKCSMKTGSGNDRNVLKRNHHPTVKPLALMEYLCRLTKTPTGGIVLDPFAGSGTTCMACVNEGRDFVGIEKEPEYVDIARRRIKWAIEQKANEMPLFTEQR